MPLYHFNVFDTPDLDGTELTSPAHAKREGMKLLGALLAHGSIAFSSSQPCLEITGADGTVLFRLGIEISDTAPSLAA